MVQVDVWVAAHPPLAPRRLLPALLRFGEPGAPQGPRAEALRYVRFCMVRLQSQDLALHNLAVRWLIRACPDLALLGAPASGGLHQVPFGVKRETCTGHSRGVLVLQCAPAC